MRRVLIVDDHEAFRATARRVLEADGWEVVAEASDASSAVRAARTACPDVALVDLGLRSGDGIGVAHALAQEDEAPVVVMISGWDEADVHAALVDAPIHGFLSKSSLSGEALEGVLGP